MEYIEPILQIFQFIGAPIGRWCKYFKGVDENMKILKRNLEELNSRKDDIVSRLTADLQLGNKLSKREVKNWLDNVQKINTETQGIEEKVREKRCVSRARLGKLVEEMVEKVEEYYRKGSFSDGLVVDAPLSSGVTLPTPPLVGETTAKKYMNEILEYLMGDEIWKIGVCGMGGVGKTTIMKHINNELKKETEKFDDVIWVTVSKELDVIKLQNDIACALNNQELPKDYDKTKRAGKLWEMLENKKRYVLILDDMWEAFPLEDIGIPEPTSTNGCKLILTTRSLDVCRIMNFKVITVGLLTKEEAWNLFLDKVDHDVLNIPTLVETVKLVAEERACLPLAIVMVASSMTGVHGISEWRNALNELRGRVKEGMENEVFEQLKFSYDRLKDRKVQQCFLYCALYPEDYEIRKKELVEFWIAEGLVDEISGRVEYDKGYAILHRLENSSLLERLSIGDRIVKMHDLDRDMALDITRGSPRFMVKVGMQLNELPNEQEWMEDLEKVSLMENSISEIPSDMSPKCPRLKTLLLQRNPLKGVSNSFFLHMFGLKVLDLSYTSIEILPNSIANLEHLTALLLRGCSSLKYVPSLATLKALRELDLMNNGIEEVPQGMEMLVDLRRLNLGGGYLRVLLIGILPKLSRLQCLIVGRGRSETINVKAEEVGSLRKLETFVGNMYDLHDFNVYAKRILQGLGPDKYLLQVGSHGYLGSFFDEEGGLLSTGRSKCVVLRKCNISREGEDPLVLPNNIDYLLIEECHNVSNLSHVLSSLNTTDFLKECDIISCDGIEGVLSSSSSYHTPLQSLEVLRLHSLRNLDVLIFRGEGASPPLPPPPGTFSNLKTLDIYSCPNIKKLFTIELLPHFQNLEALDVYSCDQMEEIIAAKAQGEQQQQGKMCGSSNHSTVNHDDDAVFTITFPNLSLLSLQFLPKLKSIVCGRGVLVCDSLQQINLHECPKLKRLPLCLPMRDGQPSPPPSLQRIQIDRVWWESLEWDHPTANDVLHSFINYTSW